MILQANHDTDCDTRSREGVNDATVTVSGNNLSGAALKFLACHDPGPVSLISISDGRSAPANFVAGWFCHGSSISVSHALGGIVCSKWFHLISFLISPIVSNSENTGMCLKVIYSPGYRAGLPLPIWFTKAMIAIDFWVPNYGTGFVLE
jgi:hypothetical protein